MRSGTLPKLSIITVVKNDLEGLKETVSSIRMQDYPHLEHLIIDGDSEDQAIQWLKTLDPQPDFWLSEPDQGIYHAMNKGLEKCSGDWVNFLNAGDRLAERDSLSRIAEVMTDERHLVYSDVWRLFSNGTRTYWPQKSLFRYGLFQNVCHQATWYNLKKLGKFRFDTSFRVAADANLLLQFLALYQPLKYFRLSVPLVFYKVGGYSNLHAEDALKERSRSFQSSLKNPLIRLWNHLNLWRQKLKLKLSRPKA